MKASIQAPARQSRAARARTLVELGEPLTARAIRERWARWIEALEERCEREHHVLLFGGRDLE
ncbi:MAG TPA: hypothetical protein RMG45_13675, partial [Polyangiaceae bacterium LLY-WYZ-15_(1-7)]|nr:hypothetical protein [Polyangiaceae bacterium LLY-WYZ-15_(1-7)]